MKCSVVESGSILGEKWVIPIIEEIALGNFYGFNNFISKARNITPRVLSMKLKELEKAGIVQKRSHMKNNHQITEYVLTKKGIEFNQIITEIKKWNIKWNSTPESCFSVSCMECGRYRK